MHILSVAWGWVPSTGAPRSEEEALPEDWDVLGQVYEEAFELAPD